MGIFGRSAHRFPQSRPVSTVIFLLQYTLPGGERKYVMLARNSKVRVHAVHQRVLGSQTASKAMPLRRTKSPKVRRFSPMSVVPVLPHAWQIIDLMQSSIVEGKHGGYMSVLTLSKGPPMLLA